MQKIALIYNPASGTRRNRRLREIEAVASVFEKAGKQVAIVRAAHLDQASTEVFQVLDGGFDTLIACGGDGTVHNILQAVVTSAAEVALGVIPFGSGNILARDLHMPSRPVYAARLLLSAEPRQISVGRITSSSATGENFSRFWMVAAGIGADARIICEIDERVKSRYGVLAYYAESAKQLLLRRYKFPAFMVEFEEAGTGTRRQEVVTQIVAERVNYFARCLQPCSEMDSGEMQLILFKTARRSSYVAYGLRMLAHLATGVSGGVRDIVVVRVREVSCRKLKPGDASTTAWRPIVSGEQSILAEADGELLRGLPVKIDVMPLATTLLYPVFKS
jgi:diacylglycerol kinase family enzyme